MTVLEMTERLKELPPDMTVCLADWNEGYLAPSEPQAEIVKVQQGQYMVKKNGKLQILSGEFVQIGEV